MCCVCAHELIESTLAKEQEILEPKSLPGRRPRQLFNWVTAGLLAGWIALFGIVAANTESRGNSAVSTEDFIQAMLK